MDPIGLFERAATRAAAAGREVRPEQLALPTPCTEWDVATLLEHMASGPVYLLDSMSVEPPGMAPWPSDEMVRLCVASLRAPGALDRRCMSPAGFEWSVAEAAAGTAMDQLIHTWDLAVATGGDTTMDPQLAEVIVTMFLPQMPEVGRQAGFVGPEVAVGPDASPADRLLGAMGRDPRR